MDVVLSTKIFKPASIKRINDCCLYRNMTLLSDITWTDGVRLDKAAYEGNKSIMLSRSPGHCVNQAKPNDKAWREWRHFLHVLVNQDPELTLNSLLQPGWCHQTNTLDNGSFFTPQDMIYGSPE